jgi:septum formation protein
VPAVRLVLASGSPRRRALLGATGVAFTTRSPDVDETPRGGEDPRVYVERLARQKAAAVASAVAPGDVVLAADTTVWLAPVLLGKPADAADARRMLRALSGRTHEVHTGVAVVAGGDVTSSVATTRVIFADLDEVDVEWYVGTGEPLDKAGAYAVQGSGKLFVRSIEGSPSNVVGLPLDVVAGLLDRAGYPLHTFRTHRNSSEEEP